MSLCRIASETSRRAAAGFRAQSREYDGGWLTRRAFIRWAMSVHKVSKGEAAALYDQHMRAEAILRQREAWFEGRQQ